MSIEFRQAAHLLGSEKVNLNKQYNLDLQYTGALWYVLFMLGIYLDIYR